MRTRTRSFHVACVFAVALGLSSTPATAGEPSARDLIARAPVIRSSDEEIRSIEIAGYERADGKILRTFRALYRAPDRFAFVTRAGYDGTPLSFAAERKMLVYDPVRPEVLVFHDVGNYRTIAAEGGKFEYTWGCKFTGDRPGDITLDLKSLFTAPASAKGGSSWEESVVKTGENRYVLTVKQDKFYRRSRVDLNRPEPFATFEIANSPDGPPRFCVDKIVVNGELKDEEFAFPSTGRLAGTLKVREIKDGLFAQANGSAVLMRAYHDRQTIHEPPGRGEIITPFLTGIRRGRIEEHDRLYAKQIRELIPDDKIERVVEGPGKSDGEAVQRTRFEAIRDHLPHLPYKVRFEIK